MVWRKAPPTGGRPYSRFRLRVMERDEWLCQPCLREGRTTAAEQVDHIQPRHEAPERLMDETNAEGICVPHHRAKSLAELAALNPQCRDPVTVDPRWA